MAEIVGSIRPAVQITESEQFERPTVTLNLRDASGELHGQVRWVSSEVDEAFDAKLLELCITAFGANRHPSSAVSS